jgi:hypothetical protein
MLKNDDEKKILVNEYRGLFEHRTNKDYLELLAEFQVEWNKEFSIYFVRNIHPNIDRIGILGLVKNTEHQK